VPDVRGNEVTWHMIYYVVIRKTKGVDTPRTMLNVSPHNYEQPYMYWFESNRLHTTWLWSSDVYGQ